MAQHSSRNWYSDVFLLSLIITLVNYCFLGSAALFTPDEARYVEIPREMLMTQQFIVPHLDGIIYFEKPALYYWIVALVIKIFGYGEWATRSCPALLGLGGCIITYLTARKLFNRRVAILASLILSSSLLYFGMSHLITMDMPLTFFLTASLYSFIVALEYPSGKKRNFWLGTAYALSGLAMMTKGLIGVIFPGMIVLIWIALLGNWKLIKNIHLFAGIAIILVINLPWLLLVQQQEPSFLHFYFIEQQFARYATPIADRHMAILSYIAVFLTGLFPWIFFLPQSIKKSLPLSWHDRKDAYKELYLLIWPSFIFLFFGFSHSLLIPYLLPVIPPLAIILALYFDHFFESKLNKNQKISILLFFSVSILLCFALYLLPHFVNTINTEHTNTLLVLIAIIFFAGACLSLIFAYRNKLGHVFISILITTYLSFVLIWAVAPNINSRSIKPLALTINTLLQQYPEAEIVNFGNYHQDLPYYTRHLVIIVNWQNELSFGLAHQADAKTRLIDSKTFWQLWQSKQRLYVLMSQLDYARLCKSAHNHPYLLQQTHNDVLITNL